MKFSIATILAVASAATAFTYERLDKSKALLLILDMQEGLFQLARDFDPVVFKNNMYAHAEMGKIFGIPTILTTSAETGPNGPLPDEFKAMYPDAPYIRRMGEVDAWDNAEFRAAVKAANRTQIIIGGITTDVCTAFLALSLQSEGYSVWANVEASGTTSELVRDTANDRMRAAGVNVVTYFHIMLELMRDWRNTPGALEIIPVLDKYYPIYGVMARSHRAAVANGSVIPGEAQLP